ncbi:uncharacterized protein LOC126749611 [Anthonomus grandis grandis]|uniref:uncharacterized protein LOC126749611 n=1 Tax=Anthonomus grandis grandis TaxID=2921223 RepID=UPI0021661B25|nr:uncharacterized protein LOC126749611 [Anthonomus grandis grandis]
MARLTAPKELLEKLLCTKCEELLSVFPVYIKTNGKDPICGRCKISEGEYIRDEAYERLAQFLIFPCALESRGCQTALTPLKMKVHEICCTYETYQCPFANFTSCKWSGSNPDIPDHLNSNHEDAILADGKFSIEFQDSFQGIYLMYDKEEMFIIKTDVDAKTKTFVGSVEHLLVNEISLRHSYMLQVASKDSTLVYEFPRRSTDQDSQNDTRFTYDFIKKKLEASTSSFVVTAVITSVNDNDENIKQCVKIEKIKLDINEDMLRELECPVCYEYMLPPIYQCINGHSICESCKDRPIKVCPKCTGQIRDTRNFALEKLTAKINYSCKYRDHGCTVVRKSENIREHERCCEYGSYNCPLAEWVDCDKVATRTEIMKHVRATHDSYILKSDKIVVPFGGGGGGDQPLEGSHIIAYANRLFVVCYQYKTEKFYWTLQLVGPIEECQLYSLKVEVIDNSKQKLHHSAKGVCVPVTKKADYFAKRENYILFYYDQISHLISDERLTFKVKVLKSF